MFKHFSFFTALYFSFVFFLASVQPAHAYLDPGSGSFALQFLLAGGLGAMYFFRSSLSKVKTFLMSFFTKDKKDSVPSKSNNGK